MQKINILLQRLAHLQQSAKTNAPKGVFNSTRKHPIFHYYKRNDDNLFFTSLTIIILNEALKFLKDDSTKATIRRIKEEAFKNYPLYKNKAGGVTYNFWQEHPKKAFPNSKYIFKHPHFHIPDDLDDTAIAFLAEPHSLSEIYGLKRRADIHINTFRKKVVNTFSEIQNIPTYTTWSGNKMYYEFDVCVLCNVLCCFRHYQLPKDTYDKNAITLIEYILKYDYHFKHPFETSHHYANTTLILYHLARLCEYDESFKKKWASKLKDDIEKVYAKNKDSMGEILLANALLKLDYKVPLIDLDAVSEEFPYFIIGLLTPYEQQIARKLAPKKIFWLEYYCEAYSIALKLEYVLLKYF